MCIRDSNSTISEDYAAAIAAAMYKPPHLPLYPYTTDITATALEGGNLLYGYF